MTDPYESNAERDERTEPNYWAREAYGARVGTGPQRPRPIPFREWMALGNTIAERMAVHEGKR